MTTTPSAAGGGGHTPGEWLIARTDKAFVYSLNEQGYNRFWAHVQGGNTAPMESTSDDELAANATLIANAPNLLSALKGAANYIDNLGGVSKSYRIAIAAATGASQ